jgi:branched-chain amino acid transport system ATP-binding protein
MSEAVLETRAVTKRFDGFTAVAEVDLAVERGSIHAVIGPNGAGKTTFFRLLTGIHRPTSGRIVFAGEDITGRRPYQVARAGLTQSFQITNVFPRMTVLESLQTAIVARRRRSSDFFSFFHRDVSDEAHALLDQVDLDRVAGVEAATLSHGDQRVLEVTLALATEPQLLLLDEPTAGMSPWETERMVELIVELARTHGLTVVLSEHDMDVVFGISQRVTVLHQGRVVADGTPEEVRDDEQVVAVYLGSEA